MITVRFPNGHAVQYNDANYVVWNDNHTAAIYKDSSKQHLFARAPQGALVELQKPCRTYDGNTPGQETLFDQFMVQLRVFPHYRIRDLKRALQKFDAKKQDWKA